MKCPWKNPDVRETCFPKLFSTTKDGVDFQKKKHGNCWNEICLNDKASESNISSQHRRLDSRLESSWVRLNYPTKVPAGIFPPEIMGVRNQENNMWDSWEILWFEASYNSTCKDSPSSQLEGRKKVGKCQHLGIGQSEDIETYQRN